jgi:hypothetical protein
MCTVTSNSADCPLGFITSPLAGPWCPCNNGAQIAQCRVDAKERQILFSERERVCLSTEDEE